MEIVVSKDALHHALQRLVSIADKKSSFQIISNVLIETTDSKNISLSVTDLSIWISGSIPAKVLEKGSLTVPAKMLNDIIRNLPNEQITLRKEEENLLVTCGRTKYRLFCLPADEFPQKPKTENLEFFSLPSKLLFLLIENTSYSISTDEGRSHLNGALFEGDGKIIRMITTDGHRLSKYEVRSDEAGFFNFSIVVPQKTIIEIKKFLDKETDSCSLSIGTDSFFLSKDFTVDSANEGDTYKFLLVSKLLEKEFPDYEKVIPTGNSKSICIAKDSFNEALKRVSLFSYDKNLSIKIVLNDGYMNIYNSNPSIGDASEQIDVSYSGDNFEIGLNAKYFIDILNVFEEEEVIIELSGPLDPMVVKDASSKFIGVIMPMRI